MSRPFIALGALNALLAVGLGAFGAHGLKTRVTSDMLAVYHTGVQYHITHALGLALVGVTIHLLSSTPLLRVSGWLMLLGILLFSGSLYLLALTGTRAFGIVTPFGGLAFLAAWLLLALGVLRA